MAALAARLRVRRTSSGARPAVTSEASAGRFLPAGLSGGLLALAAFPHVFMATQAFLDNWDERAEPGVGMFLDYQTYDVSRWAFVVLHLWVAWGIGMWRRQHATPLALRLLVILMGVELGLVYFVVAWLRLRGIPLGLV